MIYYTVYESPIGDIFIASTDKGICKITLRTEGAEEFFEFLRGIGSCSEDAEKNSPYINQLNDYFKGKLKGFDVKLDMKGTDFQIRVWNELKKIPYGQVRTYGDISKSLGASCPRSIGQANKKNPLPIIVPCHRVVSSSGIGGYSGQIEGSSIDIKRYLLNLEGFECSVFDRKLQEE